MNERRSVGYDEVGPTAMVTLRRPDVLNAIDAEMASALREALARADADPDIRTLVIAAEGRAFCTGVDLSAVAGGWAPSSENMPTLLGVTKPVIVAVNGPAYGAGFQLCIEADLCVASTEARFGVTEARWGRGAPWAAELPILIPPRVATEMLLAALPIDAARAEAIGLVNRVVPSGALRTAALELAQAIAANAPLSVAAGKAMVRRIIGSIGDVGADMAKIWAPVYASDDAIEGPRAFREKRTPVWSPESR
jgi:enoyl-CoA hydratase/carnithine racemase